MNFSSKSIYLCLGIILCLSLNLKAQHEWQKPLPPRSKADLEKIMGPIKQKKFSKDLNVVWVWSKHDHDPGFHEYEKVRDKFKKLFKKLPQIKFQSVYKFPTEKQWKTADLVVFYLHLDELKQSQYDQINQFVKRGGGLVAIHEAMIMRPTGDRLASCLGLAWDDEHSSWGVMPTPYKVVKRNHDIFKGFDEKIDMVDEFYWNLTGEKKKIDILAVSQAGPEDDTKGPPDPKELDGKDWPLFWTKEEGKGRVFASLPGHNLFSYDDPYFRIILLRAMAWTTKESFDPFKPLVTEGIKVKK